MSSCGSASCDASGSLAKRRLPFLFGKGLDLPPHCERPQYLRQGQVLPLPRMESRNAAAGGRGRHCGISAAVGESEEQRKPERFSGHRKAVETDWERRLQIPAAARKRSLYLAPTIHRRAYIVLVNQVLVFRLTRKIHDSWGRFAAVPNSCVFCFMPLCFPPVQPRRAASS